MKKNPKQATFLAFDFGAESARAVIGQLVDNKLQLTEIHRFPTRMISMNGHYYWNVYRFYEEMVHALTICVKNHQLIPESVAVDSWGVDFGILASDDTLIRIPYAYRDDQVVKGMQHFHQDVMSPTEIYALTGIAMQPFNSLYHLHALRRQNDLALANGKHIMFIPDLLNFLLCGEKKTEFTFATTTQLYNPNTASWEPKLLDVLGIDAGMFNDIVMPGQHLGQLNSWIAEQTGLHGLKVANVCSHDTGSAIVAVPAVRNDWVFISSGTWSIMGIELHKPVVSAKSFEYNFSNEGGAAGTYRFLKNIMGLWLLQQCSKGWAASGNSFSYPELVDMAEKAVPFVSLIDPVYPGFYNPDNMPAAISQYCRDSGQEEPASTGAYVRIILESLALKYRKVLEQITEVTGKNPAVIHVIGGGTQNKLLCQFTANATGKTVIAGPAEGTAVGNIMMQAYAYGYVDSIPAIRDIVSNTFETETFLPQDSEAWDKAYRRFLEICC